AAKTMQGERRPDRQPGPRAQSATTILAQIGQAVLQRPDLDRPAAAERAEADVLGVIEFGAQRGGDLLHGDARPVGCPPAVWAPPFPRLLVAIPAPPLPP